MLAKLRRAVRRIIPRPLDDWLDAPVVPTPQDVDYAAAYESALHDSERVDSFGRGRFDDGRRWRGILERAGVADGLVLDLASGSGGVALALAAGGRRVVTIDREWSETGRLAHRAARTPYRHVIAEASALPFKSESFAAIICLDSFEHFADPARTSAEASRVARSGAPIAVETPARIPNLFRRDPHYGIPCLLLLPNGMQRRLAIRRGFTQPHQYTHRIYASAASIGQFFPRTRILRLLGRSRFPKRWFFSAVILRRE
ncbi:MAG TPA: class I SAM-dependent methyltransferase [Thermoanaerobaculia bacterium]|nr:class I SAM-dependent methyltransferase [Thermoanaerobaculia bacterium]